ncbi:putative DNA repair protein [Leptomonas seymouri]|uniref:Putative DNA repair protein n=1 Tax=Leptomonas seymouri TaxID=5684 RepID=A0A0N1PGM4_LEPSE|nr:putative DNA repair protein [Leptomonas seymouri]|eukprot:KPI90662.1 putative DNA repair protein [Leptomonas seymouri]
MEIDENATALLNEAQTCSRFIAAVSAREMPDNHNVQLCVLSVGFDVEGVVAELLHRRMRQRPRRVYCVVVPENLPSGSVTRLSKAIERHLMRRERERGPNTDMLKDDNASVIQAASSCRTQSGSSISVVAIDEGTRTKERCAVFQRGAVVLLTSRSLCADLLHRRLAVELVGMAIMVLPHSLLGGVRARVQDALAPQSAFCVELLLRSSKVNSAGLTNTERHAPPPVVVLSDDPMLMRGLVQRHHMGAGRFVQQLHVGDVQLFPRFRLDIVRHFEELSRRDNPRGRPLEVDRIIAPVSPSLLALDGLLANIVRETLQELQRLEQQQQQQHHLRQQQQQQGELRGFNASVGQNASGPGWSPAARRAAAAAEADEDAGALRFLPRARFTATTLNEHLDYGAYPRLSSHDSSGGGASTSAGTSATAAATSSYVRHGWRVVRDEKGIWFNGISEAAALAVDFSDLDSDLRAVVRRHDSQWPFRLLSESLIDVRRLRRAARGTAFSFLLHLESVLEKRLPQRDVFGVGARPPAALWTLSSHFNDVVTVATHRIGTVVYTSTSTKCMKGTSSGTGAQPPRPSTRAEFSNVPTAASDAVVVVVDSSDEDEDCEVRLVESSEKGAGASAAAASTTQVPQLLPNTEEQEADVEVVVRLVMSWCRTMLRRHAARKRDGASAVVTAADAAEAKPPDSPLIHSKVSHRASSSPLPTLLLLTLEAGAVVRYTERLTHDRDTYQRLQLRRFMHLYQAKYGVALQEFTTTARTAPEEEGEAEGRTGEGEVAAMEPQLTACLFEADNPDDAYSEDERCDGDAAGPAAEADGEGGKGGLAGWHRKFLQQRDGRGSGAAPATQPDPSALYGEGGGGASVFHQALLSQMPPLPTQSASAAAAPTKPARDSVKGSFDYEGSDADCLALGVSAASSSTLSTMPLTLSVERVRAGAVTLQPRLEETEGNSVEMRSAAAEGVPRVLILDGSQLSATELTMLLDGSHEALALSVPSTSAELLYRVPNADSAKDGAPAAGARLAIERVILSRHQLSILRQLEMAQDELPAVCLRRLKVQLITTSLAEVDFKKTVQAEQEAFEGLAHTKATLTGTLLVDQSSLQQTEEALESGLQVSRRRGIARSGSAVARLNGRFFTDAGTSTAARAPPPCVIFDEREFRSTLPYDLFKRGVDLVPLTLTTADYVLSPEYAVERKSVQDYFQSVMSGRIQHQLAALSRKYTHPLCLIEFNRGTPFRLLQYRIYGRTAKLMANYPRVSFMWARSPAHAAGMLVTLKKSVATANADPSDPSLTGSSMDPGGAGETSGPAASAAEREAAHYAARVLSRFPGIDHQNAPRVMQLCGSLIGLATISQASLETVMGEEGAARLYNFVHTPFHESVG